MKLYNLKTEKGIIEVFSYIPNNIKLKKYRMQEIERDNNKNRIYFSHTNDPRKKFFNRNTEISNKELKDRDFMIDDMSFGKILQTDIFESEKEQKLLSAYYDGQFNNKRIAKVVGPDDKQRFFLLTEPYKECEKEIYFYQINNMISIPKSLYLLQMLEQENFSLIENENIVEQLSLFDLSKEPILELKINEIEKLYNSGLISDNINHLYKKIESSNKILKRIIK